MMLLAKRKNAVIGKKGKCCYWQKGKMKSSALFAIFESILNRPHPQLNTVVEQDPWLGMCVCVCVCVWCVRQHGVRGAEYEVRGC